MYGLECSDILVALSHRLCLGLSLTTCLFSLIYIAMQSSWFPLWPLIFWCHHSICLFTVFTFRLIAFFQFPFYFFFSIVYEFMLTSIKESSCSLTFPTFSFSLFSAHLEDNAVTPYLSGITKE